LPCVFPLSTHRAIPFIGVKPGHKTIGLLSAAGAVHRL